MRVLKLPVLLIFMAPFGGPVSLVGGALAFHRWVPGLNPDLVMWDGYRCQIG